MAPVPEKPDVELRTANGSIQSSLALIGTRPATITATSWNGAVRLRTERQGTVAIEAESKNGAVHLWLPAGFDGIVTASSGNGNVKLTNALMESAVLVPHSGPGQAWRVKAPDSRGGGTGAGGCDGGNGGNGGRKGVRAHASIEINMQFGNKASALPAPTPPVPPTPPAPSVVSPTLPKPPVPPSESASTSSIPNPFTPTDDKKSLALAYATADAGREVDDQAQERIPVRAQWERQVGEMGEEIQRRVDVPVRDFEVNVGLVARNRGQLHGVLLPNRAPGLGHGERRGAVRHARRHGDRVGLRRIAGR